VPRDAGVPVLAISGRDDPLVTPAALRTRSAQPVAGTAAMA
jgi:predicted alpha/beta-fold hydrolase